MPGGRCATEDEVLTALAVESKRRGVSYGKLVADTTECDRDKIIRDYCVEKRRKVRRSGK